MKVIKFPRQKLCASTVGAQKPNAILITKVLTFCFRMVLFSNGWSEVKHSDFKWWLAWTIFQEEFVLSLYIK